MRLPHKLPPEIVAVWSRALSSAAASTPKFSPTTTKKESTMIKPTIGRVVWLWPCAELQANPNLNLAYSDKTMPLAATVAYVHSDRMVNLAVVDQKGKPFGLTSVTLLQGDESYNPMGSYCEWMPYQKGQAAKQETNTVTDGGRNQHYEGKFEDETDAEQDLRIKLAHGNRLATQLCEHVEAMGAGGCDLTINRYGRDYTVGVHPSVPGDPATQVTDDMVSRFLAWKVPQWFCPDGHISFDSEKARASNNAFWPTGTNLLDATQARAMLEHVIGVTGSAVEPLLADGKTPSNAGSTPVEPSLTPFDFGGALNVMRLGGRVARKGWNGKGMWLGLHTETGTFTREECGTELEYAPYVVMKTADNKLVPWLCSQTDMLATDWQAL